jgi:hypothetical protein
MPAPRLAAPTRRTSAGRKFLAKALLGLAASLLALVLIEGACRAWLAVSPPAAAVGRWEFRGRRPPPYERADYFGPAFLSESLRCVRHGSAPGGEYVLPEDFTGEHVNVRDGRRRTTDQPSRSAGTVYLFGGSTVFNSEVPDRWTVASCLQRLLNERTGSRWRVENLGVSSMSAAQQTRRLHRIDVRPGDVVLFYDGVNDVYYSVYNGNPHGWLPGQGHDGGERRLNAAQRLLYPLCLKCKDHSSGARVLFGLMDNPMPRNVSRRRLLDRWLKTAEVCYRDALLDARTSARRRGAKFFHFLQPNLFTLGKPTRYEAEVAANELKALPGLDRAYALGYPRLRQAVASAAEQGLVSFDLSGILDGREAGEEYYLDFCHVNHAANQRIAEAIFERVVASSPPHWPRGGAR